MAWELSLPPAECILPDDPGMQDLVNEIFCTEEVALDTETTGLNLWKAQPLFWSLSWRAPRGNVRRIFMPIATTIFFTDCFKDPDKRWLFVNAKFDTHMLANAGIHLAGKLIDCSVMHALLYEEERHGLKQMHQALFGWAWNDFEGTFGKINKKVEGAVGEMLLQHWNSTNRRALIEYAACDAFGTFNIYEKLREELQAAGTWSAFPDVYPTLWELFDKTEIPFTKVLWHCERNGQLIDVEFLKTLEVPIAEEIRNLERKMVALRGKMFNPRSPVNKHAWLVVERELKPFKKTKGGKSGVRKDSIDKSFFEKYDDDEAVQLLQRHAGLTKMLSTYVLALPANLDPLGRAHPRFNQDTVRTGRISSSGDFNATNIPNAEKDKFKVRHAFIAGPGKKLIIGDYEQLEMRLLAIMAGEQDMIDIFNNVDENGKKLDIHMGNAAMVFAGAYKKKYGFDLTYSMILRAKKVDKQVKEGELPKEALTDELALCLHARQAAKVIGFGLNYGMKPKKMASNIGCTEAEAEELYNEYMRKYPTVKHFFDQAVEITREKGFSFSYLGRRRFLPDIQSRNSFERYQAERQAGNMIIQSSAADVARLAMIKCFEEKVYERFGARMLMQVHDEIMHDCPEETAKEAMVVIKHCMEHAMPHDFSVPLDVSIGIGDAWDTAKS